MMRIARDLQTGRRIDLAIQIASAVEPGHSRRFYRYVLGVAIYRQPIPPSEGPRVSQIERKRDDSDPVD
jgi:hypothetical protein